MKLERILKMWEWSLLTQVKFDHKVYTINDGKQFLAVDGLHKILIRYKQIIERSWIAFQD